MLIIPNPSDTIPKIEQIIKEDFAMQKLYKMLWSLAILLIIVTTVIFSFGLIIVVAGLIGVFGIYRYFFLKRRPREFKTRPYPYVEVIDLQAKVIHETIQARKPDEINTK
jgi:Flp pilus assembly protein TadB